MVNTFDRGRPGSSFEFSAPRYCNLAVELEQDLRYEDVDQETGSDWFEREHPLHEPEERPSLQPVLSPSEWGEPQGARRQNAVDSIVASPNKDNSGILKSPDLDSRTSRSLLKTPLSGSARRVRRKGSPPVETVFEEDKTRRVLKFDDGEDEEPAPARKRRRDPVVHPMREERQAREVELLLRKHNRELEARKREERLTKVQARQRSVPNAEPSVTVSPPRMNAVDEPNKGHPVAYLNDNEESGLQKMLEEHNRKVREARKRRRSQNQLHQVSAPNSCQSNNSNPENLRTRTRTMANAPPAASASVTAGPEQVRTRESEKTSLRVKAERPDEADKENLSSRPSKVQQVAQTRHKSRVRGHRFIFLCMALTVEVPCYSGGTRLTNFAPIPRRLNLRHQERHMYHHENAKLMHTVN
ncbi:hypothetical protein NDN08_003124 [Rhodosorus marinus]|uniref:Uncharacterized protein n=1 Tax=Rhodosorus marinus TaxID=101924 RepID=A0AAV8UYF2_9RHOD|nr:hypothetical protein NDN08_003124 [Rhodosorus marinus]